jgi:hypothetical protein
MKRKYLKTWRSSLFTFAIGLSMVATLIFLPTVFAKVGVNLDQFQNGHPPPTGANWSNGNINAQNSVYHEGQSVPFRYFVTGVAAGSNHFFTIQMDYKKGGKAAYDYLTSFDRNFAAGLQCSTVSTAVPNDCGSAPFLSAQFPDPDGSVAGGYLPFHQNVADAQRQLTAYNVSALSVLSYNVIGTTDSTINITVQFTASAAGSVGLFWGGHLARATDWGAGNGASSISGAPFHMRGINLDNGGATNQDRSVQPGAVLPEAGCGITPIGAVCGGSDTVYSSPGTATGATYDWSITGDGAFLVSGSTTTSNQSTTTVTVRAGASGSYTLNLLTDGSGFEPQSCSLTVTVNAVPVASIATDNTSCGGASLTAHVVGGDVTGDTYQWTASNGGAIPSGQGNLQTITPTAAGTYSVVITRSGCASASVSGNLCFAPVFTAN